MSIINQSVHVYKKNKPKRRTKPTRLENTKSNEQLSVEYYINILLSAKSSETECPVKTTAK